MKKEYYTKIKYIDFDFGLEDIEITDIRMTVDGKDYVDWSGTPIERIHDILAWTDITANGKDWLFPDVPG